MRDRKVYRHEAYNPDRAILHVDMDAFYAQVEQLLKPALRGKPIIVGFSQSKRGVVTACSYEARVFGVRAGMPTGQALRLCPKAIVVPGTMDAYADYSERTREVFNTFTPYVDPASIDEAYLDITDTLSIHPDPVDTAVALKKAIKSELRLSCSVGVAACKHMAKVASAMDKPDGLTTLWPHELDRKLFGLKVGKLFGVGPVTSAKLNGLGLYTVGDLATASSDLLKEYFGANGEYLKRIANGLDDSPVMAHENRPRPKSISHESTFNSDSADLEFLHSVILHLTDKVVFRMRKHDVNTRNVTLRVRYSDFKTITRSRSLPVPLEDLGAIFRTARSLLPIDDVQRKMVRLLGVKVSELGELDTGAQELLFADVSLAKLKAADEAVGALSARFGKRAIVRAGSLRYLSRKSWNPE
jgi:DNA polymerase-4